MKYEVPTLDCGVANGSQRGKKLGSESSSTGRSTEGGNLVGIYIGR